MTCSDKSTFKVIHQPLDLCASRSNVRWWTTLFIYYNSSEKSIVQIIQRGLPLALSGRRRLASCCSGSGWQTCVGMASALGWGRWFAVPPTRERGPSLGGSQPMQDLLHSWSAGRSPASKLYLNKVSQQFSLSKKGYTPFRIISWFAVVSYPPSFSCSIKVDIKYKQDFRIIQDGYRYNSKN